MDDLYNGYYGPLTRELVDKIMTELRQLHQNPDQEIGKIRMIKLLRNQMNMGLRDAANYVRRYWSNFEQIQMDLEALAKLRPPRDGTLLESVNKEQVVEKGRFRLVVKGNEPLNAMDFDNFVDEAYSKLFH